LTAANLKGLDRLGPPNNWWRSVGPDTDREDVFTETGDKGFCPYKQQQVLSDADKALWDLTEGRGQLPTTSELVDCLSLPTQGNV
jgi:hypothetical protein